MKKTSIFFIIFMIAPVFAGQIPFSKGVNLTNWFQACCPQNIPFTKYTKQDFINIQSLGCDVIRLPVRFHDMTGGPPDYVIDPLLYMFLDHDLNIPLLEALGFNIPKQKQLEFKPDSTGFVIYSDYVHHGILHSGWPAGGMIEYYHSASPAKGTYCIFWTGSNQYGSVGFDLRPVKDLSLLADQDYALHLWIKGDNDEIEIDLRFIDTVTDDSDDRPWRMRYTLNKNNAVFDGKWHPVTVLLNDFEEHGAWDGEWHNPRGDFDWSAVDRFEMTAEHHPLGNMKIWLDEIKIDRQASVLVKDNDSAKKDLFRLEQNYPNPFNNKANIVYEVSKQSNVVLEILDIRGRTVEVLVNRSHFPGRYEAVFDAGHLPSGVYLCRLLLGGQLRQRKMLLLK